MTLREVHSEYIPDGYVNSDIDDIITELKGIWKYASLDLHVANDCKKTPEEYIVILIRMWDYLDTLPIQKVESAIVELEGKIVGIGREAEHMGDNISEEDWIAHENHDDGVKEIFKEYEAKLVEGRIWKVLRTQLEQYLAVRIEQDGQHD